MDVTLTGVRSSTRRRGRGSAVDGDAAMQRHDDAGDAREDAVSAQNPEQLWQPAEMHGSTTDTLSLLRIFFTNDDGINVSGAAVMREELTAVGDVTVVVPAENQSGVGRVRNEHTVHRDHPWGYALEGIPVDCVAYALRDLDADFDAVVSGINDGPNAGDYVVGRPGTVDAGVGATFLGMPAIAVSSYRARDFLCHPPEGYDFSRPAWVARVLIERVSGTDVFDEVDLLSVNAPVDMPSPRMCVTRPFADYDQQVDYDLDAGAFPDGDREHDLDDDEVYVRL